MKKPGKFAVWFLLFAGACFLLRESVELIRFHQANEFLVVQQIEEKHIIIQAFNVLASERQGLIHRHEADVAKLVKQKIMLQEQENASQKKGYVTSDSLKDAWAADPDPIARERRAKVKGAMIHAWSSYEKYAWGFDQLRPMAQNGMNDPFTGGLGATIINSLDTLYMMELHDEFVKATEWVSTNLHFNRSSKSQWASVSDLSVLFLGGLISAYDLSGNPLFITKAQDLADRLLPAWDTATGIPLSRIDLASGSAAGGYAFLSYLGAGQVEMIALSQRTGVPKYGKKTEKVISRLRMGSGDLHSGPMYINQHIGHIMGEMEDFFCEFLLKVWVLGDKSDDVQHYRDVWEHSMEGLISQLRKSNPSSYVYVPERYGQFFIDEMDTQACLAAGMLTLGADGASPEKARRYLKIAEGLAETCYNFYMSTPTHLAGDRYHFRDGRDMVVKLAHNSLRPETIESFFYLWRKTGDSKYREWGWDIFQAFESHSRIPTGYVGLHDVYSGYLKADIMPSFFPAETLKYLYLLFSPSSVIPLDEWVFNTAGHPVRIVNRRQDAEDNESQNNEGRPLIPIVQSTSVGENLIRSHGSRQKRNRIRSHFSGGELKNAGQVQ